MKSKEEIIIKAKAYAESIGNEDGLSAYDYVMGYNKCQEDMADKKYTEEDLRKAISEAQRSWVVFPNHNSFEDAQVEFMYNAEEIIDLLTH